MIVNKIYNILNDFYLSNYLERDYNNLHFEKITKGCILFKVLSNINKDRYYKCILNLKKYTIIIMPIVNETFSDDAMEFPFSSKTCSVYFSLNNKAYDDSLIPKKQFIKKYNNILKYY